VNRVSERALDVLLMRAKTRVVSRNGVSVDGRMYWNERFFGLRGMECTVRWDPGDIGQVVVSIHEKGKADQVVIATSEAYAKWAEGDYETLRAEKKRERQVNRDYIEQRHRAAEGITPYEQVLMEVQQRELPVAQAVNGTPVITPGHHLARAIDAALKPVNRGRRMAPSSDKRPTLVVPPANDEPETDERPERPIFTSQWEREEWEREHGDEPEPAVRITNQDVAAAFMEEIGENPAPSKRLPVRLPDEQSSQEALPFRLPAYVDEGRTDADEENPPEGEGPGQTD